MDDDDLLELCAYERQERYRLDWRLSAAARLASNEGSLELLGFDCGERRKVKADLSALGTAVEDIHVTEIFSPPRATAMSPRFGLTPCIVVDRRSGWDLNDPKQVDMLWDHLVRERPLMVVGSPECRAFSQLHRLNQPGSKAYYTLLAQGLMYMAMMEIYTYQVQNHRFFLHEQPLGNDSWHLDVV